MKNKWYKAKVIPGRGTGRQLGFPTLNLDNPKLLSGFKEGVYAALIKIKDKQYKGVLYYGPRLILQENENIIEIFVFNFAKKIYDHEIHFQPVKFIRRVKNFPDLTSFKKQLEIDCQKTLRILK